MCMWTVLDEYSCIVLLCQVVSRDETNPAAARTKDLSETKLKQNLQPQMDFGMSKPEDKDMYTTRG